MDLQRMFVLLAWTLAGLTLAPAQLYREPLPLRVQTVLENADRFEVLSIDPGRLEHPPKNAYHGWIVIGRTMVRSRSTQREVVEALFKGLADSGNEVYLCFEPRHGIRATFEGQTVDVLVCFHCRQVEFYFEGKKFTRNTTAWDEPVFNRVLKDARVPLAPKSDD